MKLHLMSALAGLMLDLLLGDPQGFPHPVRAIGNLITILEKGIRRIIPKNDKGELWGGFLLVLCVLVVTGAVSWGLILLAGFGGGPLLFIVETIMCYYALAAHSLYKESMKVYSALKRGQIEEARVCVSMIVGRDTNTLTEEGIAKAAVETVAENTSDGVIAPLIFLFLGGPVIGWLYKAVNTMDSMVGYKNQTYLYFGRAAAILDDMLNFLPSRISAFLMLGAAGLLQMDAKNGLKIYIRDRLNHKSPNSAQTEAVCAGALRVRLGGDAWYFGTLCKKPTIGDELRTLEFEDIKRANLLMYGATTLLALVGAVASFIMAANR